MKRRKIAQMTKSKEFSHQKMDEVNLQPYRGYPQWRNDGYEEHSKILNSLFERSGESIQYFEAVDPNEQV